MNFYNRPNVLRCTGIEIAALVSTLAGAATSEVSAVDTKNAMNNAVESEIGQQQQYAKQGQQVFENSLSQSTPQAANTQIQQGTQAALNEYQKNQSVPLTLTNSNTASAAPIASTQDKVVQAQNSLSNQAAAPLQGYTNYSMQQWLKDLNAKSQLQQIGSFAQESANLLPLQLSAAQGSQAGLAGIGSLLSTAGGLAGIYGGVNGAAAKPSASALVGGSGVVTPAYANVLANVNPYSLINYQSGYN